MPAKNFTSNREKEPIAIVGIGCRFPGDANDPESFWRLLSAGVDAITEIPADRWSVDAYYHPTPGLPGKTYSRWGGFIKGLDLFEPEFFGISPREASHMDPQQRLLLEVAWEALEDGGHVAERLAGGSTGVFVGISTFDYAQMQSSLEDKASMDAHSATGGALSIAANRISYFLGTRGPSLAVDTACSSSLVAMDLACRSIWSGECSLALAGGVNAIIMPLPFVAFCAASMLSPEGRCKAFDADANGFVRGEGAGIVVLKPLSRAVADGDRIYALVVGTGVNQDGRTGGIAVPNPAAQEALLRKVYQEAGIEPAAVRYVEAHGTGTEVGDPIEAWAIGRALSGGRSEGNRCLIGSVKTNIGHLEAAAGIAGVIKTALALKHRTVPPNLHFRRPNPRIPFEDLRLRVPISSEPWPEDSHPGIAGVNSFGFGGTNAHIVMMEHRDDAVRASKRAKRVSSRSLLLPLSARTSEALAARARSYAELLTSERSPDFSLLRDIAYNASLRRDHFDHRLALVAESPGDLREGLEAFLAGEARSGVFSGRRPYERDPRVVFVFSGQGPQWWGMGRQLLQEEPVFRKMIEGCDRLLRRYADWSLLEELHRDEAGSRLNQTAIAQPALFALQVSLAELWKSWGVTPDAVIGHSVGEVAAAYVAGALDLENAARVIFHRGRCMDFAAAKGKMLAVALSEAEAEGVVSGYRERAVVAAVNSPSSTVLSGDAQALEEIRESLSREGVLCRFLPVEYAFHSPQMESLKEELLEALAGLAHRSPALPIVSTVIGGPFEEDRFGEDYWWLNVRKKVLFSDGVRSLIKEGYEAFVELSPHPVLSAPVSECLSKEGRTSTVLPSLKRQADERAVMLGSLGALYALGHPVNWETLWPGGGRSVRLPAYPWQRQRYWHESERSKELRLQGGSHSFLERKVDSANPSWQLRLDKRIFMFLEDHRVQGQAVVPAAAYVEAALAAIREALGEGVCILEEVKFQKALFLLDSGEPPGVQLTFQPDDGSFSIHSKPSGSDQSWLLHAAGYGRIQPDLPPPAAVDIQALKSRLPGEISAEYWYAKSEEFEGVRYGPSFQGIKRVWRRDGEVMGRIAVPDHLGDEAARFCFHPVLLDACFQVLAGALPPALWSQIATGAFLPVRIGQVRLYRHPAGEVWSRIVLKNASPRVLEGDVRVYDSDGNAVMEIEGFQCQNVGMRPGDAGIESLFYEIRWRKSEIPERRQSVRSADFLPGPREIVGWLESALSLRSGTPDGLPMSGEAEKELDALAAAYAVRVLHDLGWRLVAGERFHLPVGRPRLAEHVLGLLEKAGYVERGAAGEWIGGREHCDEEPERMWSALLSRYPSYLAELWLVSRCGASLAGALRGEDVSPAFLQDGAGSLLDHLYQDSPSSIFRNRIVRSLIHGIATSLPERRSIRILEMGGGVGALASHLLPGLSTDRDRVEYLFSDVSETYFDRLQQKFHRYPFVALRRLELQEDLVEQGFEPHSFDLVLARKRLFRHGDIKETVISIRKLLASQGLLALPVAAKSYGWLELASELMEDPMRAEDPDRKAPVSITPDRWSAILRESGFGEVEGVSSSPVNGDCSRTVLLARAPRLSVATIASETATLRKDEAKKEGVWLVFADRAGVGTRLSELLERLGEKAILVRPGTAFRRIDDEGIFECSPSDPEAMAELLASVCEQTRALWRGVVHLWSLDADPEEDLSISLLRRAEDLECSSVLHLLQSLDQVGRRGRPFRLALVTRGAQAMERRTERLSLAQSFVVGLARVVTGEFPDLLCKAVDLDAKASPEDAELLFAELTTEDPEEEVVYRDGIRWVPRLERAPKPRIEVENASAGGEKAFRLEIPTSGSIDHLTLREVGRRRPGPGQVEIEVAAASLNFRDVMKALGLYPLDGEDGMTLGDECSGRIVALGDGVTDFSVGDEVFALAPASLGNYALTAADFVMRRPSSLSVHEAATMPVAFLTAYYALVHLGRIREGERVLIHSAAGGVGLAAVQIARQAGAEIFATAGSPEKREFLKCMGIAHVMDSRSLLFADEILHITGGRGVDVVLNSLGGKAIAKGLSCLAPYGRFLELGKRDIYQDSRLGLWAFRKNLSFFAIDLGGAMRERRAVLKSLLAEVDQRIEQEKIRPLPHRVFPISRAGDAFRYMAQAKHVGKIVLSMREQRLEIEAMDDARPLFRSDATYLITGGLGGFGLAVAGWIAESGGQNLVLMGRSGAASEESQGALRDLRDRGVQVKVVQADVSREEEVEAVLLQIDRTMPPLRGVFHAAMVLDDGILLQLDSQRFRRVVAPKADGAWILHSHTLSRPLDFFVLFSSVSSLTGTHGQGSYVAANAFLDALAHYRRVLGLPATAVNWGHLAEVGYVSRNEKLGESLTSRGVEGIAPAEAMKALGLILRRGLTQVGVMRMDWQRLSQSARGRVVRRLSSVMTETPVDQAGAGSGAHIREALQEANQEERATIAESYIREQVARVLGASAGKLDVDRPLSDLGLDSLMAIELKNRVETDLVLALPTGGLVQGPSIKKLSEEVLRQLGKDGDAGPFDPPEEPADRLDDAGRRSRLVPLRAEGMLQPLFCVHPGHGAADIYKPLVELLPLQLPIYGVQSGFLNGSRSLQSMAREYGRAICDRQPRGPYFLLGFSLGGFIAVATAKFLEEQGARVAFIGLVDCDVGWKNPSTLVLRDLISETYRLIQERSSLLEPLGIEQLNAEAEKLSERLLSLSGEERIEVLIDWLRERRYIRKDLSQAALRDYLIAFERHVSMAAHFEPPSVRAPLFVWYADEGLLGARDGTRTWAGFTSGPVTERTIRGSHFTIMRPPSVSVLAEEIGRHLCAAHAL